MLFYAQDEDDEAPYEVLIGKLSCIGCVCIVRTRCNNLGTAGIP